MKKIIFIVLLIGLYNCRGAKYIRTFEKGKSLNFNSGKWVLNEVYEERNSQMFNYALKHFGKIIGDSLFEMQNVRNMGSGLMRADIPFELAKEVMEEVREGTGCDYLINIKATVLNNEMSSFTGSTPYGYGSSVKKNSAKVDIKIYDLNELVLLSSSSIIGVDKRELNEEQDWGLVTQPETIKIMGLYRLMRYYKKHRVKK